MTTCKNGHNFEDLEINSQMYDHTLEIKKVTVGFETTCLDCDLTINLWGSLDIEVKGEDY